MLDQLVERAREEKVFYREDTPTEDRAKAAVLYHLGLSYRTVGEWLGHSHQAFHEWFTKLADLFEPEPDSHRVIVVDETKVKVEDEQVYVWAAINRRTFEVIPVEVSPGRSELDALLFLRTVLERTRGEPLVIVDRGPWYNWPLDDLDLPCEARRETWGDRSIVESWFTPGSGVLGSESRPAELSLPFRLNSKSSLRAIHPNWIQPAVNV